MGYGAPETIYPLLVQGLWHEIESWRGRCSQPGDFAQMVTGAGVQETARSEMAELRSIGIMLLNWRARYENSDTSDEGLSKFVSYWAQKKTQVDLTCRVSE